MKTLNILVILASLLFAQAAYSSQQKQAVCGSARSAFEQAVLALGERNHQFDSKSLQVKKMMSELLDGYEKQLKSRVWNLLVGQGDRFPIMPGGYRVVDQHWFLEEVEKFLPYRMSLPQELYPVFGAFFMEIVTERLKAFETMWCSGKSPKLAVLKAKSS